MGDDARSWPFFCPEGSLRPLVAGEFPGQVHANHVGKIGLTLPLVDQ